jgi:hypothetical protein
VKSLCETSINSGSYEAKEVFVSVGLKAIDYHHTTSNESSSSTSSFSSSSLLSNDSSTFPTVLSKDNAFVQLNGQSKIEVDENGIFISIPTMPTIDHNNTKSTRSSLNTGRRGLRIAGSSQMKLVCVQSSSLILSIPVKRKTIENTSSSSSSTEDEDSEKPEMVNGEKEPTTERKEERKKSKEGNGGNEEEKMRQFLSSSILAIPWTYEGHSLSPAAYIAENESKLSLEEREKLLKEAEEDSIIFANTVVMLAEFISSVPENTEEILICFSCSDKSTRDLLGILMKLNCCFPLDMNRYDRLASSFPWLLDEEEQQQLMDSDYLTVEGDSGRESGGGGGSQRKGIEEVSLENNDLKKRLKTIEEENSLLKRERNELTKQLLETKEEMSMLKVKGSSVSTGGAAPLSLENRTSVTEEGKLEDNNSSHSEGKSSVFSDGIISISEKSEEIKELATKIIELETKLNISMKKEVKSV